MHCNFKQKCDLFQAGYGNAQEIIRFIDAKSGAVSGLVTLAIGGTIGLTLWALENADSGAANVVEILFRDSGILAAIGLSICFGSTSLFFCLLSLIGRPPPESRFRVLFPCFALKVRKNAKDIYENKAQSLTEKTLLDEYCEQLSFIGPIIYRKLHWHRWSLIFCAAQFAAAIEGGALLVLCMHTSI